MLWLQFKFSLSVTCSRLSHLVVNSTYCYYVVVNHSSMMLKFGCPSVGEELTIVVVNHVKISIL